MELLWEIGNLVIGELGDWQNYPIAKLQKLPGWSHEPYCGWGFPSY
jgi:hypothetical protein